MTDTTTISKNGKASVPSRAVGVSGVVSQGGVLYNEDYDRSWRGHERDKTIISMLNDPLIGSVLGGIEMLVRRVDWRVDPADDTPAAEEAAQYIQECLDDMEEYWPGDTLARALTFLGWGWSCLEIVYKTRSGPGGKPSSRFTDGKIGWHRWALRPQSTRYGWRFDGDDPVVLIQQDPTSFTRLDIPLEKCILFRYASRDNSPEGSTPLRICYDAWYNKRKLQRIEAIGIERDLAGMPIYYLPGKHFANGGDESYTAAQNIATNIRLDAQMGAVVPGDRDDNGHRYHELVLLSTGGAKSIATDGIIKRYANEIVTVFLANIMRAGQDGVGTLALGQEQNGLFQQAIGAHLDTIAQTINEQAIGPLCRLNGIPPEMTPTLDHGNIESADLDVMGRWLTVLSSTGAIVMTPELQYFLGEIAGLPVPSVEDIAAQKEAEAAAAEQEAKNRLDAMRQAQGNQTPQDGQNPAEATTSPQNGKQTTASEVKSFVESDGTLTLTDLLGIVEWWNATVDPQYRGLLNAEIVGNGE